jgi:hypothetical protein
MTEQGIIFAIHYERPRPVFVRHTTKVSLYSHSSTQTPNLQTRQNNHLEIKITTLSAA